MQTLSLTAKIGQRLVAGFPGTEPGENFLELVRRYKVGNVILFRENIVDEEQLTALCAKLRSIIEAETGLPPFITIDQEGGVVTRLPDEATNIPGAMALAATGNSENARRMGFLTGLRLRKCGVNFNLAPDMDVNCNPDNPVIGVRSYGDDPAQVSEFGSAMLRGLADGGVYACLKHFPGHGDTAVDSHLGLPCIDKSMEQLEQMELVPFRAGILAGVPAVMSSHILFPQIEPKHIPATMSRTIMTGLLREKLGFTGLSVSDCMEMQAIQSYYGTANGVLAAMGAGVDLIFITHTPALAAESAEKAAAAFRDGMLDMADMDASIERILTHKQRCEAMKPVQEVPDEQMFRDEVRAVREKTITAVNMPEGGMPALGSDPLFLGCRDYRSTLVSNNMGSGFTFAEEMRKRAGIGAALVTPKDPSAGEIAEIVEQASHHSAIVLGTYNGHILKGQLRLADALAHTGLPMIAVALRNPYDLAGLPAHVAALAGWEYSRPLFDALWPVIAGDRQPTGKLPLKSLKNTGDR
jgi:beta-N-acetylhexosaminidase